MGVEEKTDEILSRIAADLFVKSKEAKSCHPKSIVSAMK
jgi:hypothetical protein